ncbi:hypothetical protein AVEN_176018-1 [Araneus ventricosus]|uniref:Uncharacterized protein n=1 Tax=Araneus ventricosus TaxID=182803 RepID=A0A4Y2STV3_ARAVE|nr:hypothetical protein AVEN_176018-1 [Araneus ventricosus]
MIPENATLFSIFLLRKGIHEKTPCDVTACRREYLRTAPGSEERLDRLVDRLGARTSLEFYPLCELISCHAGEGETAPFGGGIRESLGENTPAGYGDIRRVLFMLLTQMRIFVARTSVAAARAREIPGIFESVRQSPSMYRCWWTQFWTVVVNIALVDDAANPFSY